MIITTSSFSEQILSALRQGGMIRDRLPGDILQLPNSYYDVKIKVNDFVISDTINYSLNKLHENWLYLISKSIVPSNNIPNMDYATKIIIDDNTNLLGTSQYQPNPQWVDAYNNISTFVANAPQFVNESSIWTDVKHFTKVTNIADPNNYNIIANTTTNMILLSGTGTSSIDVVGNFFNKNNPIWSNSNVTHPSNELTFSSIVNHVVTDNNELFVLDDVLKTIFKFDISGILTLDRSILQNETPGRLMTGMIGGDGQLSDKTRFFKPVVIETVDSLIYTIDNDQNETIIKVFNSDLNWKTSVSIGSAASKGPVFMKYNDQTERFYILCHRATYARKNNIQLTYTQGREPAELVILDKQLNYLETRQLNSDKYNKSLNTQVYRKIYFSNENKNIMYVVTNKNILKKYVSRPEQFIGSFLVDEKQIGIGMANQNFADIDITTHEINEGGVTKQKDQILLIDTKYKVMFNFLEDSNYERSLQTSFDNKVLEIQDMQVQDDEFVSTLTYNKVLSKHMYNNMLLLENTYRKFTTKFNQDGISQYIGFRYLNEDQLKEIDYIVPMDSHIGNNEILLTSTINRCLNQILMLQQNALDKMQENSINVFPLLESPIMLTSPYTDFAVVTGADTDDDGIFDVIDTDDDDDRLLDTQELTLGTDPLNPDTDDDSLTDYHEVTVTFTNPVSADTDDDTIADNLDLFPTDPSAYRDTDSDGMPDEVVGTSSTGLIQDEDDDNDTILDVNDTHPRDPLKATGIDSEVKFVDAQGNDSSVPIFGTTGTVLTAENPDGLDDVLDVDDDDDGFLDYDYTSTPNYQARVDELVEGVTKFRNPNYQVGVDPVSAEWLVERFPHGDLDPLSRTGLDTDLDGVDDIIDPDDDNDNITDYEEIHGTPATDPLDADTDDDSLDDYEELNLGEDGFITDPTSQDTDNDTSTLAPDDLQNQSNTQTLGSSGLDAQDAFPTDPSAFRDTDGDGDPDEFLIDQDGNQISSTTGLTEDLDDDDDNVLDATEILQGTDPKDSDSDDDLAPDDTDPDPLISGLYIKQAVNQNNIYVKTIPENTVDVIVTTQELDTLFVNPGYLRDTTPYDTDESNYVIGPQGLELTVGYNFENVPTNPLTVHLTAYGQSGEELPLKLTVGVTDVDEDRDSDLMLVSVDETDLIPQLKFIESPQTGSVDSSGDIITITWPQNVIENLTTRTLLFAVSDMFVNHEYLSTSNPVSNPNTTDFTVDQYTNVYVNPDRDYETSATITTDLTAHGQQINRNNDKRFIINVNIDNTDQEDTDSDTILDTIDLSKSEPQLQFNDPHANETDINIQHSTSIEENNDKTQLVILDDLFANPEWFRVGTPVALTAGDVSSFEIEQNENQKWILYLSSDVDFETITHPSNVLSATMNISGQETPVRTKTVTYLVTITNTDQEDTDSDTILDADDLTDFEPQLQFNDPHASETDINIQHSTTIEENNNKTQLIVLDDLFANPGWFRAGTPVALAAGDVSSFEIELNQDNKWALYLSSGVDFETITDPSGELSATINISGQETPVRTKTITYTVTITNTDQEDTDSDTILDTVDLTKSSPQLQFVDQLNNTTFINSTSAEIQGPTISENNDTRVDVIDLSTLFVNSEWLAGSPYQVVSGDNYAIDQHTLYIKSQIDYELSGDTISAMINVSGQETPAITKTITVSSTIIDENILVIGEWDDDHTTTWEQIDTNWEQLSGS